MLVLTRRPGESVRIGSEIRMTVLSASGSQVKLGIEAPSGVQILREEVFERIAEANRESAAIGSALEEWPRAEHGSRKEDAE